MTSSRSVQNVYAPVRVAIRRRVQKSNGPSRLGDELRASDRPSLINESDAPSRIGTYSSAEPSLASRFVAQVLGQALPSTSDAARAMRAYAKAKGRDPDARFIRFL